MKANIFGGFLLLAALVTFAPLAHAQVSDNCEVYYCTAYAAYSGSTNVISGYVEYYDDTEEVDLGIDVYMDDEYLGDTTGVDDIEYDISSFNPTSDGTWDIIGYPWYDDGEQEDDGSITYSVQVVRIPTGETNAAKSAAESPDTGSYFNVYLTPSGWDFDGYNVSEAFNGSATDTCCTMFHVATPLGNPTPGSPQTVAGNNYTDEVAVPTMWVSAYQGVMTSGQSCYWSTPQSMSYNSTQYIPPNTIKVNVTPSNACATRAGTNGVGC